MCQLQIEERHYGWADELQIRGKWMNTGWRCHRKLYALCMNEHTFGVFFVSTRGTVREDKQYKPAIKKT